MATYLTRTTQVTTKQYVVPTNGPWGAPYVEIEKAVRAAMKELVAAQGQEALSDDAIRVHAGDYEIVIEFSVDSATHVG